MNNKYQHTQIGFAILILSSIPMLLVSFVLIASFNFIILYIFLILLYIFYQFRKLVIVIDEEYLLVRFGEGLIKKAFLLDDIASCVIVRTHWYYGLGIRLTINGWLFAVSGLNAVHITMKNGKRYLIGTDDQDELFKAIQSSITH